ncbi:uncharacterized protein E0L32_007475 [Thyridium curvatum]|uniref:Cytochrome P450 n=1 Tax=Thyridium curvatum TaxID=1093900 RepID=A0A507B4E4_9PEZI|nr:uncharacterized protein E0L32_007475 [Thyridium curvatum]TPX11738.1 hypothetical protein E0L32_007475 [Thyridium curvatum]
MSVLELHNLCAITAAVVALYLLKTLVIGLRNPRAHIPGPWYARFTNLPHNYTRIKASKHRWTQDLHAQYGPIVLMAPNEIVVSDPVVHQKIHAMGTKFLKGPLYETSKLGEEHSLFSLKDPKKHAERRRLFSRAFTVGSLRKNWETQVRERVDLAIELIKQDATQGTADVYKIWRLLTGDVISQLSFGESFHMLESGAKTNYFEALQYAGTYLILKHILPFFSLLSFLPVNIFKKMVAAGQIIHDQGTTAVDNLRNSGDKNRNLFSDMLDASESGEKPGLTDDVIRSDVALFMVAGSDTTAVALTYVVWAVLRRPELQRRLEEEVALQDQDFTDETLEKLPLLNNVIDESLRLYNPGGGPLQRVVPPGGVTFLGHYIPEGTVISTLNWNIHRNPVVFPNPEKFDETRFENPTADMKAAYNPFMLGSRSCIGVHLAKMELRLAIAKFFRECRGARLGKEMTEEMMEMQLQFLFFPVGGKLEVTLRDDA